MNNGINSKGLKYPKGTKPGGSTDVLLGACPKSADMLDVGCASGYLGEELRNFGCKIWGVDVDKSALDNIPRGAYEETLELDLNLLTNTGPFFPRLFDVALHLARSSTKARSLSPSGS